MCLQRELFQKRLVMPYGWIHVSIEVLLSHSLLGLGNYDLQWLGAGFCGAICAQGALLILCCQMQCEAAALGNI